MPAMRNGEGHDIPIKPLVTNILATFRHPLKQVALATVINVSPLLFGEAIQLPLPSKLSDFLTTEL